MDQASSPPDGRLCDVSVGGLAGAVDGSLAHAAIKVERHVHGYPHFFGVAATPTGAHKADLVEDLTGVGVFGAATAFTLDAGNEVFGTWVQLLGSGDTPVWGPNTHYDMHWVHIRDAERAELYILQFAFGAVAADAVTAKAYSVALVQPDATNRISVAAPMNSEPIAAGTLAWARAFCPGQNTATINILPGLHEYTE